MLQTVDMAIAAFDCCCFCCAGSEQKGVTKGWGGGAGSWFDAWLTSAAAQVPTEAIAYCVPQIAFDSITNLPISTNMLWS